MKEGMETILEESGIKISVDYRCDQSASQREECHGYHEVGLQVSTELTYVMLIIDGRGINILPSLNETQKDFIISKLSYE